MQVGIPKVLSSILGHVIRPVMSWIFIIHRLQWNSEMNAELSIVEPCMFCNLYYSIQSECIICPQPLFLSWIFASDPFITQPVNFTFHKLHYCMPETSRFSF